MAQTASKRSILVRDLSDDALATAKNIIPFDIEIHNLRAKVYLNCPLEDLVPEEYALLAEKSAVTERNAWIFRDKPDNEDGRNTNLDEWSYTDLRYKRVFKELKRGPDFENGLYNGGSIFEMTPAMKGKVPVAQADALREFLGEIIDMLDCKWEAKNGKGFYYLNTETMGWAPDYFTGHGQRYSDSPIGVGCVMLQYFPSARRGRPIVPMHVTTKSQDLETVLAGKVKLMLGDLFLHLHRACPYGDKMPHQETFLFGMHGSRFHIFRAWFPGPKTSAAWCQKQRNHIVVPVKRPTTDNEDEIKAYNKALKKAVDEYLLRDLGGEGDMCTFRVASSREFDLFIKSDFKDAVKAAVAVMSYLMSGRANIGTLMDAFDWYSHSDEDSNSDDSSDDEQGGAKLRQAAQSHNQGSHGTSSSSSPAAGTTSHGNVCFTHSHPFRNHQQQSGNQGNNDCDTGTSTNPKNPGSDHYRESRWLANFNVDNFLDDDRDDDEDDEEEAVQDSEDNDRGSSCGFRLAITQWMLAHTRTLYRIFWSRH